MLIIVVSENNVTDLNMNLGRGNNVLYHLIGVKADLVKSQNIFTLTLCRISKVTE